jgi:hypothetical protein
VKEAAIAYVMILRVPPNLLSGADKSKKEFSRNAQTPRRVSVLEPSNYETESERLNFVAINLYLKKQRKILTNLHTACILHKSNFINQDLEFYSE